MAWWQRVTHCTTAWRISMGRRQVVESVNAALKGVFTDRVPSRGVGMTRRFEPVACIGVSVARRTRVEVGMILDLDNGRAMVEAGQADIVLVALADLRSWPLGKCSTDGPS
jgi:hypothetical protein